MTYILQASAFVPQGIRTEAYGAGLPYGTNEPLSKMALMQRFIGFTEKLSSSRKAVLRNAFNRFKMDCRCTTGANLRAIMLECDKNAINSLSKTAIRRVEFHPAPEDEEWRIPLIKELLDIRDSLASDVGWSREEIESTLEFLSTT